MPEIIPGNFPVNILFIYFYSLLKQNLNFLQQKNKTIWSDC